MSISSYPKTSFAVIRAVCLPLLFTLCICGLAFRAVLAVIPTPHWVGSAAGRVRV
jgi:hypothetical protein